MTEVCGIFPRDGRLAASLDTLRTAKPGRFGWTPRWYRD
jgi:hypothetical protein